MKIFLSGYMGSGKSIIGRLLGDALEMSFLDLDTEIEMREKKSIREIFKKKGEIYFRKVETQVLERRVNSEENFIMAVGGGTPCYGQNLQLIKKGRDSKMIFLKATPTELTSRLLEEREKRPLLNHLTSVEALEEYIRKHLFERNFYYNQADLIISTDQKAPKEIVQEIRQRLN